MFWQDRSVAMVEGFSPLLSICTNRKGRKEKKKLKKRTKLLSVNKPQM